MRIISHGYLPMMIALMTAKVDQVGRWGYTTYIVEDKNVDLI